MEGYRLWMGFLALMLLGSCKGDKEVYVWKSLEVDVSAYNSVPSQTDGLPNLAAWGDTLKPGMKCIAVSRDLIGMGLDHDTQVRIHGLEGIYVVKDKMHRRWKNRIDIYMGKNVKEAREWGRRKLLIEYRVEKDTLSEIKNE